jgi:DNA-binding XRE family transcriptional regulator
MPTARAHQSATRDPDKPGDPGVQPAGCAPTQQSFVQDIPQRGQACSEASSHSQLATVHLPVPVAQPEASRPAPSTSRVPDAFPGGVGTFPNNPAIAAGLEAISKGGKRARFLTGGWEENESGRLHYIHRGSKTGRILVYPKLVRKPDTSLGAETLWHYVENLNPFTADVALAVLAQMCEPSVGDKPKFPLLQPVPITAQAILRYKGIRRRGSERSVLLRRIHDEMERLRGLNLDVESLSAFNPASGRFERVSWQNDRLFDIVKVGVIQETLLGETRDIEVAWQVRAGQWAYLWLSPEARVYVGKMARVLLELDHRENRGPEVLAKKIGQRVLFLYYALRSQNPLKLRVGNLLEDVGELPQPKARSAHWAGRTRDNFEQAMTILEPGDSFTDGIGIFRNVEWPQGHGPDDSDRRKGWPENWLSAVVLITMPDSPPLPPDSTEVKPKRVRRLRRALRTSLDERIGPAIRHARLCLEPHWTQQGLAERLGISLTYLSLIESNKRQPSQELTLRIRRWLESREPERQ